MAPEQEENPLCFSAVFLPMRGDTRPVKIYNFKETDLKDGFVLGKFHSADLRLDNRGGELGPSYPFAAAVGYSPVSRSYLLAGGSLRTNPRHCRLTHTRNVWSFEPPAAAAQQQLGPTTTHTWGIRATLSKERSSALAVPYDDGRIFIFAGDHQREPSLEIYDPRSASVSEPVVFREDIFPHWDFYPLSYFLWKDSSSEEPRKERLIMLHLIDMKTDEHKLLSYNVQEGHLEIFDPDFPLCHVPGPSTTLLVPLDGIDILLITVRPGYWLVYDMSSKKKTGVVRVADFERDRRVKHAFSRRCLDGSYIVCIFMEDYEGEYYSYAVCRVQKDVDGKFTASLESEGRLGKVEHRQLILFPDQGPVVEEAPYLGGGCKPLEAKRGIMKEEWCSL